MTQTELKKRIIKQSHKHTGFKPYTISIAKLCNLAGNKWYLNQIIRQLDQRMEEMPTLMDHVYIDSDFDYCIDTTALLLAKDILMSFFDEKELDDLMEYVVAKNATARNEYEFNSLFKNQTTGNLLKMKRLYRTYPTKPDQSEALEMVKNKIEQELKQRWPLNLKFSK